MGADTPPPFPKFKKVREKIGYSPFSDDAPFYVISQ